MNKSIEDGAIVVPWDFSDNSRLALNKALELARESQAIRVLHVAAPLAGPDNGVLYDLAEKQRFRVLKERFHRQLKEEERSRNIYFHVEYGHVCPTVVRFAAIFQADLIVMTDRQRSGFSRLLFGRLAEQVERKSHCSVHVLGNNRAGDGATLSANTSRPGKIVHVQN